jgi:hypothetical protein
VLSISLDGLDDGIYSKKFYLPLGLVLPDESFKNWQQKTPKQTSLRAGVPENRHFYDRDKLDLKEQGGSDPSSRS